MMEILQMRNPWEDLPKQSPFVLQEDLSKMDAFMQKSRKQCTDDTFIHLELLPEPFLGDPEAPVVLLNLNPGFSENDAYWHSRADFVKSSRDNLVHRPSKYPFYLLNPEYNSPGERWWGRKLKPLINELSSRGMSKETSKETIAQRVFCVEYFGYHSKKFGYRGPLLRSQEYGLFLVRKAIERQAIIVIMRSRRLWISAVPQLGEYQAKHGRCFELQSPQNPTISKNNCPDGFDEICSMIGNPTGDANHRNKLFSETP